MTKTHKSSLAPGTRIVIVVKGEEYRGSVISGHNYFHDGKSNWYLEFTRDSRYAGDPKAGYGYWKQEPDGGDVWLEDAYDSCDQKAAIELSLEQMYQSLRTMEHDTRSFDLAAYVDVFSISEGDQHYYAAKLDAARSQVSEVLAFWIAVREKRRERDREQTKL